jgi:hypothetical protein
MARIGTHVEGTMRWLACIITAAAMIAPAAASAAPRVSDLTSPDAVLRWINDYRANPDPGGIPAVVRALSQRGAFKDPESAGVYVGFLAGVINSQGPHADELIGKIFPLPSQDHWAVVRAIAYSGHPDWKGLLRAAASQMPARQVMIERYLAGKLPLLAQVGFEQEAGWLDGWRNSRWLGGDGGKQAKPLLLAPSPDVIDTLWGFYFATGSERALLRIVEFLPWSKDRDDVERLTLGGMAKFTLASNAARDAALLTALKRVQSRAPKDSGPILAEVIEAAETVDTARIRKQALAAIEELRRKGAGSTRKVAWWGQIGQGALALGCIGAAATGHIEFGLPCVLGGATSSAALRYWTTQE